VIIPSVVAISQAALDRLRAFAQGGGTVISLGRAPALVVGQTFLHARGPAQLTGPCANRPARSPPPSSPRCRRRTSASTNPPRD